MSGNTEKQKNIVFNISKKEQGNPNVNLKKIIKKYRQQYKCVLNKEEISTEKLKQSNMIVFGGPKEMFTKAEFDALNSYLERGGNILVLGSEGGEKRMNTNINYLLEQYNMSLNNDGVVRTNFYKYFNPKEVLIEAGIVNKEMTRIALNKNREEKQTNQFLHNIIGNDDDDEMQREQEQSGLQFVYVNGCTLNVQEPAVSILSSGSMSYPQNKTVMSCCTVNNSSSNNKNGKIVLVGSVDMFTDEYFEKEDNQKIFDVILKYLLQDNNEFTDNDLVPNSINNEEAHYIPDIQELAENLKCCLQESDELPLDFTNLITTDLFKFDVDLIPESVKLYKQMNLKHDQLTLIPPLFEVPYLGLQPALFPPILKELPPPKLELFDLDGEFASEKIKLAQVTNKCNNSDIDYYIRECGDILGLKNKNNSKAILRSILQDLINFKKLNQG